MKNEIKEFWDKDRINAFIKFGLWLIFIIFIVIFFKISNNEYSEEKTSFKKYEDMQKELLNYNYEYNFKIKIKDKDYVYSGIRCNNLDEGYRETEDGIIKYIITDNEVYKSNLGKMEAINTIYEEVDQSIVDINMLFKKLENSKYNVSKDNNVRLITYENEKVVIETDLERINKINIIVDDGEYNLTFTNTNKCDSISK